MTESTTDDAQFDARYGDVAGAVDELRDAVLNAGPSEDEHDQAMDALDQAVPGFFRLLTKVFANYVNNQAGALDPSTVTAAVKLVERVGEQARDAAFDSGARVLGGAINRLAVTLSVLGEVEWVDKTPDA